VEQEEEVQMTKEECEYKLVGVVIHMGTADAGHYISYINVDRQGDSSINTEEWLKTEN
jgi:ubiquitin C-terminal hydrolase